MKRNKLILSLAIVFCILEIALVFAWNGLMGNPNSLYLGSWQIAEWLINYEGGFVRRGLSGQLLYLISDGSSVLEILFLFVFLSFLIYCLIFILIYFLADIKKPALLILALLLPGGIFQMGMTLQFFTRKEILFLIAFGIQCSLYLWAVRSSGDLQKKLLLVMGLFSLMFGLLLMMVHEAYVFMGYPFALILLWIVKTEHPKERCFVWVWWAYLIAIPTFFIVAGMNHGNLQIATKIWHSINLADREILSPAAPYSIYGPIASIGWGLKQHLMTIYGVFATSGWLYWPIFIVGNGLALAYITLQIASQEHEMMPRMIFLIFIAILGSAVMYFIAADWGRWTSFITNSALLLVFTLSKSNYVKTLKSKRLICWTPLMGVMSYVILIIYSLSLVLPECCISPKYLWMRWHAIFHLS